jgi:DNA-binding NarL/FixJ family response regulator
MQPRDQLTAKEIQVTTLVWEGLTNREIAKIVGTTEQVVKNYLRTAFDKLGVWSRLELALYVAGHGGADWASHRPTAVEADVSTSSQPPALAFAGR